MDLRKLKTLIDLVQQSGIAELEITEGEEKVRIARGVPGGVAQGAPQPAMIYVAPPAEAVPAPVPAVAPEPQAHVVNAPMVGTFYRSPAPGAKVFVEVGDPIKSGETVCIIEAMKLLNEIEADRDGVIKEIFVENGEPVEYGQPLFAIA